MVIRVWLKTNVVCKSLASIKILDLGGPVSSVHSATRQQQSIVVASSLGDRGVPTKEDASYCIVTNFLEQHLGHRRMPGSMYPFKKAQAIW